MRPLEDVLLFTHTIGSSAAFEDGAVELLWRTLTALPGHSTLVEVGVEMGRSTSVLAQAALDRRHRLVLIDPFLTYGGTTASFVVSWLRRLECPFTLHVKRTVELMPWEVPPSIDLLHVDGDHTREGVATDCETFLPRVRHGGFACFHDYGRGSLPEVWPVVNHYMRTGWTLVGEAQSLGVFKKT